MLGIILCDDDQFILKIEEEKINTLIEKYHLDAGIVCMSTNYKDILQFVDVNPETYLYFFDLDFGNGRLGGIDLAKMVKDKLPLSKVVFVTNHHDMALKVLKSGVEPFGFIEKTTNMQEMKRGYLKYINLAIGSGVRISEKEEQNIRLSLNQDEKIILPVANILYVEAVKTLSHCIEYHTIDGSSITVRGTIDKALEELGDDFIRSHRSVIVNKKYIVDVEDGMVKFSNGEKAACSFRMKSTIKGAMNESV